MDAKDRLRLYLEQRRELGESELVLDGMPVEDLLALIGAGTTAPSARRVAPRMAPSRGADEDTGSSTSPPAAPAGGAPVSRDVVDRPAPPAPRVDPGASGDWRETLRAAQRPSLPKGGGEEASGTSAAADDAADLPLPPWLAALDLPVGLVVGPSVAKVTTDARNLAQVADLGRVAELIRACTGCALHQSARSAVPGEGPGRSEVFCVGEAPGEQEDRQGRPFVGDAGQLLTKILGAIQLERDAVHIANVLKHRPPGNRDPLPEEVAACLPFLEKQVALVQPTVILALGRFAAQSLLRTTLPIRRLRGQLHRYHGIPVIVTYHPAALLRNAEYKRPTWDDVKIVRRILDAARASTPPA